MSDSGPDELAPAAAPRLFVAVWPRPEVVDALARLPRPDVPGLRWTGPDHWHVTLVFLGASDLLATRAAFQAMPLGPEAVTAELGPTTERFGRTIVHVPVAGLDEVAAAVRAALPGDEARPFRGHTVEPFRGHAVQPLQGHAARPFRGHLTLARARSRRGVDLYEVVGLPFTASFLVSEITLVSSVLGHGPPKYEVVARRAL